MALALESFASITFDLVDSLGKHTTRTVEMSNGAPGTETISEIVARAVAFWTEFDPLTLSALANMSVTLNYRQSELIVPGAGINADNAEVGLPLVSRPNVYGTFAIPSPASAIFVASTGTNANNVDPTDADVQAFMALFGATGGFFISDREHMIDWDDALFKGKRVQRRSR